MVSFKSFKSVESLEWEASKSFEALRRHAVQVQSIQSLFFSLTRIVVDGKIELNNVVW